MRALTGGAGRATKAPVRVCLNAIHAKSGGGVTYLANVLPLMAADSRLELHLVVDRNQENLLDLAMDGIHVHRLPDWLRWLGGSLAEQIAIPVMARAMGADVTYSPANFGPLLAPNPVIMMRNAFTVGQLETRWRKQFYWWAVFVASRLSFMTARHAITVSGFARQLFLESFHRQDSDRISVIPHGVNPAFQPPPPDRARQDFLLAVCDIYIQKNLHTLLDAAAMVKQTRGRVELLIAGQPLDSDYYAQLLRRRDELGLAADVSFIGRRTPTQLVELYQTCGVFVFPSTVETFGNPLVEAMASGAPIASSSTAAMPEVLGDAGLYFDPLNAREMADVLLSLLQDRAQAAQLAARGPSRAAEFSWQRTARRTADLLVEVGSRA